LILRKTSKYDATRCQILRLKCTKFDFRWGSAPEPAGRAYSAPPDSLVVYKEPTSQRREGGRGIGGKRGEGRKEEPPKYFGLQLPLHRINTSTNRLRMLRLAVVLSQSINQSRFLF